MEIVLKLDRSLCISCGLCASTAEDVFAMDDSEGKAMIIKDGNLDNEMQEAKHSEGLDMIQEAIDGCPVECISSEPC